MQFLGPAEKGIKAYGCLPAAFSLLNLSGSNLLGLVQHFGSRLILQIKTTRFAPFGIVTPSEKRRKQTIVVIEQYGEGWDGSDIIYLISKFYHVLLVSPNAHVLLAYLLHCHRV